MNDTDRRALTERMALACPLCAMPHEGIRKAGRLVVMRQRDGAQDDRRECPTCRLVVKMPRVALAAAIKRTGRA